MHLTSEDTVDDLIQLIDLEIPLALDMSALHSLNNKVLVTENNLTHH
jgi:hypothetical protein